ncbi:unnamed protein product [Closterium sp. NIES-54]
MAGPEERVGRGAGGSGQGQPRDSAMAPVKPSLGPPRDEPRVLGLDKFNGDNFLERFFGIENVFDHYDLLEEMEGTEKRPENDPKKSPWMRKSAQGYLLLEQALVCSQIRHIKPFHHEPEKRPKAWAALKGVHAPATAAVAVVLEWQMAALRIEEDEPVEEGVQKIFDLLTQLEGAGLNYSELQNKTKLLALLLVLGSSLIINLNCDLPRLSLEDVKRVILQEDFRRRELAGSDGAGAASIGWGYGRGRGRGRGGGRFGGSNYNGGRGSGSYGNDNKNYGRGRGRFNGECHFCHKSGHMWRDCYKIPDGWTPAQGQEGRGAGGWRERGRGGRGGLGGGAANMKSGDNDNDLSDDRFPGQLFFASTQSLARPEKVEGFDESATVGKMWQILLVPIPKERQVAASVSTKGKAVRSGDDANDGVKENESKKCNLGGTSKQCEHKESGEAAKEQHKGEENPEEAAEEYGESMWGTIASAAFSNPTSATGECDWLSLHRRMGHVALPILQQLVKKEMVAGIRVKGDPNEVLACPICMQAKFSRFPFSSLEATAKRPLDEVVMDVVGPLKLGAAGAEYFRTIVDIYTRMTWVYVLSKKSDMAKTMKTDWLPMVERQQDLLVKAIRTDRGGQFLSTDFSMWLKKNGIRHSLTMPYSPAMNGIAKALTHVGADKWVSYVEWIGRKPKVDILWVCGCMCMALVSKHLRHKLGAKAIWAVQLGMAQNSKGWLLWDPFTKKFLVKSSSLEHVELPSELRSGSTTTRQSSLVNGGEEAKDAEEDEEEVQQMSERAPTLSSRTMSASWIQVTPQQRQGLHSALAGAELMVGDDEGSDYKECAFAFFSPVDMPGETATLKEALESSDAEEWKKAMESELKSIEENGTWELVELPEGRKAITSKWLFKIKSDADGKIERYKSRLVAKGYQQKEKVDYKELFAPVVKPSPLRTLLAGATIKGWVVKQMDVTTTFLDGVLVEEIFMAQPKGQWYLKLREVLEEIGFMLGEGEQRSFMVVYVDDILIFSPSSDLVKEVMLKLQDKFKCKALGDVSFYLGLHIERDVEKRCMRVHQRKYLEALAANFGQSKGHVTTPFPSGFKCVNGSEEESVGEEERRRFHSLVGSLMYVVVNTGLDVAFATGQLARVVQCPNEEQVADGMRVAKYLGQTPTVGLQYSAAAQRHQNGADGVEPWRLFLTAFSDASYASEPEDMKIFGGFICCVGGGPTAWESKKQVDQALSSMESEYMALFRVVREIVWQRHLLAELGEEQQGPTSLSCDSQGAIALAKNPLLHGLTKHMRIVPSFLSGFLPFLSSCALALPRCPPRYCCSVPEPPPYKRGRSAPPDQYSRRVGLKPIAPPPGKRSPVLLRFAALPGVLLLVSSRLAMVIAGDLWPLPKPAASASRASRRSPPVSASGSVAMKPPIPPAPNLAPLAAGCTAPPAPGLVSCETQAAPYPLALPTPAIAPPVPVNPVAPTAAADPAPPGAPALDVSMVAAALAGAVASQPVVSATTDGPGQVAVSVAPAPPSAPPSVPAPDVQAVPDPALLAAVPPAQRQPSRAAGSIGLTPRRRLTSERRRGGDATLLGAVVSRRTGLRPAEVAVAGGEGAGVVSNSPRVAPTHASLPPAAPYALAPPLPESAVPPPHAPAASAAALGNRMRLPWVPPVAGMEFVTAAGGPMTGQYPSLLPVAPAPPSAALPQQSLVGPSPSAVVPEASLGQLWLLSEGLRAVHLIQVYGHAALAQGVPMESGHRDECLDAADRLGELLGPVLAAPARGGVAGVGQLGTAVRGLRRFLRTGTAVDLIGATTVVVRELHRLLTGLLAVLDADQM